MSRRSTPQADSPRYLAKVALTYPTDATVVARLAAGEQVAAADRGELRHVEAGEVVTDVPAVSVPWLLEQGLIEEVSDAG